MRIFAKYAKYAVIARSL